MRSQTSGASDATWWTHISLANTGLLDWERIGVPKQDCEGRIKQHVTADNLLSSVGSWVGLTQDPRLYYLGSTGPRLYQVPFKVLLLLLVVAPSFTPLLAGYCLILHLAFVEIMLDIY